MLLKTPAVWVCRFVYTLRIIQILRFCLPFLFPEQNIFYILLDLFHNYFSLHLNSVCVYFFRHSNIDGEYFSTSYCSPWILYKDRVLLLLNCNFLLFDHRLLLVTTFTPNRITTPWDDHYWIELIRVCLCVCVGVTVVFVYLYEWERELIVLHDK